MLRFNILPEQLKEEFLFGQKINRIGHYLRISLGILLIFSLFLIFVLAFLQQAQRGLTQDLALIKKDPSNIIFEATQKKINDLNDGFEKITGAAHPKDWAGMLQEIARLTPPSIELTQISISQDVNKKDYFKLQGKAKERQQLISFENQLRLAPLIGDLVSPLSNYEKTINISFTLSFAIKKDKPPAQ